MTLHETTNEQTMPHQIILLGLLRPGAAAAAAGAAPAAARAAAGAHRARGRGPAGTALGAVAPALRPTRIGDGRAAGASVRASPERARARARGRSGDKYRVHRPPPTPASYVIFARILLTLL